MLTASTCAQKRLSRAWASVHDRKPANYLRLMLDVLREIGTDRKVYYRQAERALTSGSFTQLEAAAAAVQGEINRRRAAVQLVREVSPRLLSRAA